jgi:hypothetical protein
MTREDWDADNDWRASADGRDVTPTAYPLATPAPAAGIVTLKYLPTRLHRCPNSDLGPLLQDSGYRTG